MKRVFAVLIGFLAFAIVACQKDDVPRTQDGEINKEIVKKAMELRNFKSNSPLNRMFQARMTKLTSADFAREFRKKSVSNSDTSHNDTIHIHLPDSLPIDTIHIFPPDSLPIDTIHIFPPDSLPIDTIHIFPQDSLPNDSTWGNGNFTCAQYTREEKDGYIIETWDYGTGCEEYGVTTKGKYTTKWKENADSYFWETIYENYEQTYTYFDYGGYGEDTTGIEKKTETYRVNGYYNTLFKKDDIKIDSLDYTGVYTSEENVTFELNGTSYSSVGKSKTEYKNNKSTMLEGEYTYKEQNGTEEYRWNVVAPVVWDYECKNSWVAVSGIEHYTWRDAEGQGEMTLDYGDGACDNLVKVTENGETETVDMSKMIPIYGVEMVNDMMDDMKK